MSLSQQSGGRERSDDFDVFRQPGAPVLSNIEIDGSPDTYGPIDAGGRHAGFAQDIPKSLDFDVLGVPVPAIKILAERIERSIRVNAVFRRRDPRHHGGVAGVGDCRQHAFDAGRVRPLRYQASQVGDLQGMTIRIQQLFRHEPVDRNQNDGHSSRLLRSKEEQCESHQQLFHASTIKGQNDSRRDIWIVLGPARSAF